jgi:hypothetical protein
LKSIGQCGVQTYIFIRNLNEIYMYEVYNTKTIVSQKNKSPFSLVKYTWHILESNVPLQKVCFKSYLHFLKIYLKLTFTIQNLKLMHNNEKYLIVYRSTKKIECITILWWVLVLLFVHLTSRLISIFNCTLSPYHFIFQPIFSPYKKLEWNSIWNFEFFNNPTN